MGKKNSVYDEVLNGYLVLRNEVLEKEQKAEEKIAEARNNIDSNSVLMDAAVNAGDQEGFTKLFEDNVKNNATIEFFKQVITKLKNSSLSDTNTEELYKKADAEITRIKGEYVSDLCKALQPVIEMSNNVLLQIELLEMAKNKIRLNLEHKQESYRIQWNYNEYPVIGALDRMLQNPDFVKEMKSDISVNQSTNAIPVMVGRNNWDITAKTKYNEEAKKWI